MAGIYDRYCAFISSVVAQKNLSAFKSNAAYKEILEHVSFSLGQQYFQLAKQCVPLSTIESFCALNDSVGSPEKFQFSPSLKCSPTSLRYVYHAHLILTHLKRKGNRRVVEIGGGYGGLCLAIGYMQKNYDVHIEHYSIIDLPEPCQLQQLYLSQLSVPFRVTFHSAHKFGADLPTGQSETDEKQEVKDDATGPLDFMLPQVIGSACGSIKFKPSDATAAPPESVAPESVALENSEANQKAKECEEKYVALMREFGLVDGASSSSQPASQVIAQLPESVRHKFPPPPPPLLVPTAVPAAVPTADAPTVVSTAVPTVVATQPPPTRPTQNEPWFCISNYAFSEIDKSLQEEYIRILSPKVDHGFMTMCGLHMFGKPVETIEKERPQTDLVTSNNWFVYF